MTLEKEYMKIDKIKPEDFANFINHNNYFSSAIKQYYNGGIIFRGDTYKGPVLMQKSGIRKSENTMNIYTYLMSGFLPSWKNYPRRNKSFICTTNYKYSMSYGNTTYIILPSDKARIGVCPSSDIWYSFKTIKDELKCKNMHNFNSEFINFLTKYSKYIFSDVVKMFESYNEPKLILNLFDEIENSIKSNNYKHENIRPLANYFINHINNGHKIIDILDWLFSSSNNNFSYSTIKDLCIEDNRELWVDGLCLAIAYEDKYVLDNNKYIIGSDNRS